MTQGEFDIRCEWGLRGVQTLAPISDEDRTPSPASKR